MDADQDSKTPGEEDRKEKLIDYPLPDEYRKYDNRKKVSVLWLILIFVGLAGLYLLLVRTP